MTSAQIADSAYASAVATTKGGKRAITAYLAVGDAPPQNDPVRVVEVLDVEQLRQLYVADASAVRGFLTTLGLELEGETLERHRIGGSLLALLSSKQLEDMGLNRTGPRAAVARLAERLSTLNRLDQRTKTLYSTRLFEPRYEMDEHGHPCSATCACPGAVIYERGLDGYYRPRSVLAETYRPVWRRTWCWDANEWCFGKKYELRYLGAPGLVIRPNRLVLEENQWYDLSRVMARDVASPVNKCNKALEYCGLGLPQTCDAVDVCMFPFDLATLGCTRYQPGARECVRCVPGYEDKESEPYLARWRWVTSDHDTRIVVVSKSIAFSNIIDVDVINMAMHPLGFVKPRTPCCTLCTSPDGRQGCWDAMCGWFEVRRVDALAGVLVTYSDGGRKKLPLFVTDANEAKSIVELIQHQRLEQKFIEPTPLQVDMVR